MGELLFETTKPPSDGGIDETSSPENSRLIFIASQVIDCILFAATLWILACMVIYGVNTQKWKKKTRKSNIDGGVVYTASIVAVVMTIPRYIINLVVTNVVYIESALQWCEVIMDTANIFYFVALYPIYLFLWLRQKALYGHPAMKKIAGKVVAVFSWLTFVLLSLAAIGVALLFILPSEYAASTEGCVLKASVVNSSYSLEMSYQTSYFILMGLLIIAQLSLLSLFIYPMLKTKSIQNSRQSSRQSSRSNIHEIKSDFAPKRKRSRFHSYVSTVREAGRKLSTISSTSSDNVQETVKRSVIFAAISMLSDIMTMAIVSLVVPTTVPRSLTNAVYNMSTLVSVMCVVATFSKYRDILTVFCKSIAKSPSEKFSYSGDDSKSSNQNSSV